MHGMSPNTLQADLIWYEVLNAIKVALNAGMNHLKSYTNGIQYPKLHTIAVHFALLLPSNHLKGMNNQMLIMEVY